MRHHLASFRQLSAASLLSVGLVLGAAVATPSPVQAQSSEQLIDYATKSVSANLPGARSDLTKLITALRMSTSLSEQSEFIEALRTFGGVNGASPPAIKAYLKDVVPLALMDFLKTRADGRARGQALLALRSFDVPNETIDEAIALARADTSADRNFVHQQAEILNKWKQDGRPPVAEEKLTASPEAQKKAFDYLRKHKLELSYYALRTAVSKGDITAIEALADAGLQLGGVHAPEAFDMMSMGVGMACNDDMKPEAISEALKALQKHGFKVDDSDENGNGMVMRVIQQCPAPVIARLIEAGARPNPFNKQNSTPLSYAFVAGQWDIAKVLIDHGAGMTKQEVDTTFMELPDDPAQKALLDQALRNAKQ